MRDGVRYLVFPGWVRSATDGEHHFVNGYRLAVLYQVSGRECHFVHDARDLLGVDQGLYVHLHPDPTGRYRTPTKKGAE